MHDHDHHHDRHDGGHHDHDHEGYGRGGPFGERRRGRRGGPGRFASGPFGPGPCGIGDPDDRSWGLGRSAFALLSAVRAAAHSAPEQHARIEAILEQARREVFSVLAEPAPATPTSDA
ncbi:hypothetical protein K6U06_13640 [Acidiferrimicrobium sp. IK]|uniref:hypothetical protein n=1 Tax=Acidiferrimicrobium sp. IK TaxID=2871700 RepID=UPI0021CB5905|nr:hypothetical protein [Acidiferrimicrobium sp. IK]MCU4185410.1 hypothetical protein [Acidiferrimicrobium sp. IK]